MSLYSILTDRNFQKDLSELSHYAVSTKQETQIVNLISKYLYLDKPKRTNISIEQKRIDLSVGNIKIEAKFSYDFDAHLCNRKFINIGISSGLLGAKLSDLSSVLKHSKKGSGNTSVNVLKDLEKLKSLPSPNSSIFMWIIHHRDAVDIDKLKLPLAYGNSQRKYNNNNKWCLGTSKSPICNDFTKYNFLKYFDHFMYIASKQYKMKLHGYWIPTVVKPKSIPLFNSDYFFYIICSEKAEDFIIGKEKPPGSQNFYCHFESGRPKLLPSLFF